MTIRPHCIPTVLVACALLVGCSSEQPTSSPSPQPFEEQIADAIDKAESGGSDTSQLQILRDALGVGSITFEAASQSNLAATACMEEAGIQVEPVVDERDGLEVPGYNATPPTGMSSEQAAEIAGACEKRFNYWVNLVYQTQPAAQEARDAEFEEKRPLLEECLRNNGVDVDGSESKEELVELTLDLINRGGPLCFVEAGLSSL